MRGHQGNVRRPLRTQRGGRRSRGSSQALGPDGTERGTETEGRGDHGRQVPAACHVEDRARSAGLRDGGDDTTPGGGGGRSPRHANASPQGPGQTPDASRAPVGEEPVGAGPAGVWPGLVPREGRQSQRHRRLLGLETSGQASASPAPTSHRGFVPKPRPVKQLLCPGTGGLLMRCWGPGSKGVGHGHELVTGMWVLWGRTARPRPADRPRRVSAASSPPAPSPSGHHCGPAQLLGDSRGTAEPASSQQDLGEKRISDEGHCFTF